MNCGYPVPAAETTQVVINIVLKRQFELFIRNVICESGCERKKKKNHLIQPRPTASAGQVWENFLSQVTAFRIME